MNKAFWNYIVDIGLVISFFLVFITGVIKMPFLVGKFIFLGWPLRELSFIHDWSGILLGVLVLVHLTQHWNFMVVMTKRCFGK